MVIEAREENKMVQFLEEHTDTWLKRDLLFFWNKYPYAKFTSGIIARALDCNRRVDIKEVLESFVKAEFIEKHTQQGLPFYCLTADPEKRQWVLNHAAVLNQRKRKSLRSPILKLLYDKSLLKTNPMGDDSDRGTHGSKDSEA